ncbi:hypothetical protein SGFS_004870 [Streptomyces graminofaciens]|uniref:Transposase n=1 Tax=Streptomyces graminofaciens TaxID=68212 RepID=A0ABN5V867_9ACTN|nr:hypothetical protein SGFS_004870 [Streptomyces graminofaciens]
MGEEEGVIAHDAAIRQWLPGAGRFSDPAHRRRPRVEPLLPDRRLRLNNKTQRLRLTGRNKPPSAVRPLSVRVRTADRAKGPVSLPDV